MTEITKENDNTIVKPMQDITAANAEDLRGELRQVLEEGATGIILDLTNVKLIDSIGLGLLAATHNSLQKKNASLELTNVAENICKILNIMRLDQHFTISSSNDK